MAAGKHVLIIGLEPTLIDFADTAYAAFPGLTAEKILRGLDLDKVRLEQLGYDAEACFTDFGETAEAVVAQRLDGNAFDCVVVGAGVRAIPANLILFEKLINVIHRHAPHAKICFNTNPSDSAEAVQRWI